MDRHLFLFPLTTIFGPLNRKPKKKKEKTKKKNKILTF